MKDGIKKYESFVSPITMKENTWWNKWNDTITEVQEIFKTTDIDTLKQDNKV